MINKWLRSKRELQLRKLTSAATMAKTLLVVSVLRSKKPKRNFSWLIKASMQKIS